MNPAASPTTTRPLPVLDPSMFPVLTPEQLKRAVAGHPGRMVAAGEVLLDLGDRTPRIFIVLEGQLEIVRPEMNPGAITTLGPGQFTGEVSTLAGRPALGRIRVTAAGRILEVDRGQLLSIVQGDADLSDVLMRAFLLRRVALVKYGLGDAVLVGSNHCSDTLRIREFLTRNSHPFSEIDLEREPDVETWLDQLHISLDDIPVLICRGTTTLRHPTNQQIADCLGFNASIDAEKAHDVVVVGAGPSGLAAAVYASSEGLDTLVLETVAPGGQAGSSSKIENYLGFPTGISGHDLAASAQMQAQKFGTQLMVARTATKLHCERKPYIVDVDRGERI